MSECEFLGDSPLSDLFEMEALRAYWVRKYCRGPLRHECVRRRLRLSGEEVPDHRMPNGKFMKSFGRL